MHIWNSFNCSYSGSGCAESWLWNEYKNRFQIYADLWDWLLLWLGVSRPGIYLSIVKETYDIEWTARKCDDIVSGWLWISSNSSCYVWPQVFPVRDMPRYLKFHWLAKLLTHSAVCTRWEWLQRHFITFSIVGMSAYRFFLASGVSCSGYTSSPQVLTKLTAKFLTVFCRRQKVGWVQALSIVIL